MSRRTRLGFVMEQTLGHVTHARNLKAMVESDATVESEWMPVPFAAEDRWQRLPVVRSNWTLRASLRARALLRAGATNGSLEALLFHTQVTALFSPAEARRTPVVVSLDATPAQIDRLGAAYAHAPSRWQAVERLKARLTLRSLRAARMIVTWSHAAKVSLVDEYGLPAGAINVIPPGIDLGAWRSECRSPDATVRLLFVGGDLRRKGGDLLLEVFGSLSPSTYRLDLVTSAAPVGPVPDGVSVHLGLRPNSEELRRLFRAADLFVFPTLGDCLPLAVMEAMASGLPVVSTTVGAIGEEVVDGETGMLLPPGDGQALASAIKRLGEDGDLRAAMAAAGRRRAEERFDGAANYAMLLRTVKAAADG